MRRLKLILTAFGLVLILFSALAGDVTPTYAQRGTPTTKPAPTSPPPTSSRPAINFQEGSPFLGPVIAPPVPPTSTNTPLPPTATNTPLPPTVTNTPVPPTVTSTPVPPTATNTSVPPTPIPTSAPSATQFPSTIVLNELLPDAKSIDWNRNGVANVDDEWVELYNVGAIAKDVSGWRIDTGAQTLVFTIPPSTTIASRGFLVYYRSQTQLALDATIHLRLLHPDGSVADAIEYTQLDDDRVHARSIDGGGVWRLGCAPTPGTPNCQATETATSSFDMPYFQENIASPTAQFDPNVVITNILLAIILALAMGFFGNLLNDAIESHEEHVARLLGPVTKAVQQLRKAGSVFDNWMSASRLAWLGFLIKLAVILIIYGTILAYLDPSFAFISQDGLLLIVALGLSTGLIGLVDDLTSYIILRSRGGNGVIRMHSGNFLVVVFSTLFSRLSGIVPGLILGSPAGIEDITDPGVGKYLDLLAILSTAIVALIAWFLAPMFSNDAWFNTLFLLVFAAGVQTVFFEMLPISYLHGKGIFQFNRVLWAILFAITAAVFLQTMLNPDGSFIGAFNSPNMVVLSIVVGLYCVFCAGIWFYLQQIDKRSAAE